MVSACWEMMTWPLTVGSRKWRVIDYPSTYQLSISLMSITLRVDPSSPV